MARRGVAVRRKGHSGPPVGSWSVTRGRIYGASDESLAGLRRGSLGGGGTEAGRGLVSSHGRVADPLADFSPAKEGQRILSPSDGEGGSVTVGWRQMTKRRRHLAQLGRVQEPDSAITVYQF